MSVLCRVPVPGDAMAAIVSRALTRMLTWNRASKGRLCPRGHSRGVGRTRRLSTGMSLNFSSRMRRQSSATGPHCPTELTELNGPPAKEPIRNYAGLQSRRLDVRPGGCRAQRTAAHPRVPPQGAGDHPEHRHRLGRSGGCTVHRIDVQRRHRAGRDAVLVLCPAWGGRRSSRNWRSWTSTRRRSMSRTTPSVTLTTSPTT